MVYLKAQFYLLDIAEFELNVKKKKKKKTNATIDSQALLL